MNKAAPQPPDSPHKKFINNLLVLMNKNKATDLFICAGAKAQMKINNELKAVTEDPLKPALIRELVIAVTPQQQYAQLESDLECNFAIGLPGVARFRVNVYIQRGTMGMVVRLIQSDIPSFESLKLPTIFKDLIMKKRGMVIVVGGTGTGKSTTLASMINYRNRNSTGHIITVEDPVEFVHNHERSVVSQREVGTDTLNWSNALKNTLRQAPDVILVGEVRDSHTMEHVIEFAQTGHLCLCTLHANNTYRALERIINFFPHERHPQLMNDLGLNLSGIISQRLISAKAGGRRAAFEIMINTPLISEQIVKGEFDSIRETMSRTPEYGNATFDSSLVQLVEEDAITLEEAMRNADSVAEIKVNLRAKGIKLSKNDATSSGLGLDALDETSGL